jgi:L-rhamnose mutarotase
MKFRALLFFFPILVFSSCTDSNPSSAEEIIQPLPDRAAEVIGVEEDNVPDHLTPGFWKVLRVHGTLAQWNQQESVSFDLLDFPTGGAKKLTDRHWLNLKSGKHLIKNDEYHVFFDGEYTYAVPDLQQTGNSPNLYQSASAYVLGVPFVFAENGCIVTDGGMAEVDGHAYKQFNVQVPESWSHGGTNYQLYVYPDTEVLRFVTWELEDPRAADQKLNQLADFPSWQQENGVLVPKVVRLYTAAEEITTDMEPEIFFYDEVKFSSDPFEESLFFIPSGAIKDDSAK